MSSFTKKIPKWKFVVLSVHFRICLGGGWAIFAQVQNFTLWPETTYLCLIL